MVLGDSSLFLFIRIRCHKIKFDIQDLFKCLGKERSPPVCQLKRFILCLIAYIFTSSMLIFFFDFSYMCISGLQLLMIILSMRIAQFCIILEKKL